LEWAFAPFNLWSGRTLENFVRFTGFQPWVVRPIRRIERGQIEPTNSVDHEPRQMILRQPIPQRRWHQESLLTITINEVISANLM
jgi:hypothetical protein